MLFLSSEAWNWGSNHTDCVETCVIPFIRSLKLRKWSHWLCWNLCYSLQQKSETEEVITLIVLKPVLFPLSEAWNWGSDHTDCVETCVIPFIRSLKLRKWSHWLCWNLFYSLHRKHETEEVITLIVLKPVLFPSSEAWNWGNDHTDCICAKRNSVLQWSSFYSVQLVVINDWWRG